MPKTTQLWFPFLVLVALSNGVDQQSESVNSHLGDGDVEPIDKDNLQTASKTNLTEDVSLQSLQGMAESWTKPPPLISLESLINNPHWVQNMTKEISVNEPIELLDLFTECLEGWEAPKILQRLFPYYYAGYDEDGRAVWICEAGKFDLRQIVEKGDPKLLVQMDKYMRQAAYTIMKSVVEGLSRDARYVDFRLILDFDGLNIRQILHLPTVAYVLKYTTLYRKLMSNHVGPSVVINANFPTETVLNLWRPIWPAVLEKMEIFGTNRANWVPKLRRIFPADILPETYGGTKRFPKL